jgi:hypothetical protein
VTATKGAWEQAAAGIERVVAVGALAFLVSVSLGGSFLVGYLGEYGIPIYEVRVDPVAVASQATVAVIPALFVFAAWIGSTIQKALEPRLRFPGAWMASTLPMSLIMLALVWWLQVPFDRIYGVFLTGLLIITVFVSDIRDLYRRPASWLFVVAALVIANYVYGISVANRNQEQPDQVRQISVDADVALAGLNGVALPDGAIRYGGLYVVFRDQEGWLLGQAVAGSERVFYVPNDSIRSIGRGAATPSVSPSMVPPEASSVPTVAPPASTMSPEPPNQSTAPTPTVGAPSPTKPAS